MSSHLNDTNPKIESMRIELLKKTPVWRKLQLMGELNAAARTLSMSGLRARYPLANEAELWRRLADLLLGENIATQVLGPLQELRYDP